VTPSTAPDADQLRDAFTRFFVERGHVAVPSASLIPHDPSILFTIAGMVPFKPFFVGDEKPPWPRATSVQKCFRTLDIDVVGTTERHCTFFEMLGNFSFGDYFKSEAIPFAWELVTEVLGIDGDRLWITVHESDDEAEQIWIDAVGVPAGRIQRLGEDNFWKMGDTGPCGPSSEIFFDKGPLYGADGGPAFGGSERFVEIWNLVFMQFNRTAAGTTDPLPRPSIDTGAGLERILPVLQGVDSIFATDLFAPMLEAAQSITGHVYGESDRVDVGLRILADHGRAPGPPARGGPSLHPGPGRRGGGGPGLGLPGHGRAAPADHRCGRARGGGIPPDPGHRLDHSRGAAGLRGGLGLGRRGLPAARHLRVPHRAHRRDRRGGRRLRRPGRLRGGHGPPAGPGPGGGPLGPVGGR
jgi:hypothetical protein